MITGQHAIIRSAELDDLDSLRRLYNPEIPRAIYLDRKRELYWPTADELREMVTRPEVRANLGLLAIEDLDGHIRGFCALRGTSQEASFSELFLALIDPADLATPVAEEAFTYLTRRAFVELRLGKLVAYCLDVEPAWRQFLGNHGFVSEGVQREMVYTTGAYHDLESLALDSQSEGTN